MNLYVKNLIVRIRNTNILPPLTFEAKEGKCLTLMGASGIGKSTLLRAISGSLEPEMHCEGDIFLGNMRLNDLPMEKRNIGLLTQEPLLFPHLSVGQNLEFGIPRSSRNRKEQIYNALERIGLTGMENRDPATLSGGEAARVALERALLAEPDAILLDEPFSKLDQNRRAEIRTITFDEIRQRQIPAIMVTHDLQDAKAANGEIIELT